MKYISNYRALLKHYIRTKRLASKLTLHIKMLHFGYKGTDYLFVWKLFEKKNYLAGIALKTNNHTIF